MKKFLLLTTIFFLVLSSTACDFNAALNVFNPKEDNGTTEEGFYREVEFEMEYDLTKGIVSLYQSVENGMYYIVTESKLSNTVKNAYYITEDGARVLIDDIEEFAITNDIIKIEVEFEPGVPLEGFDLNTDRYEGYYLGNSYTMQITPTFYPSDATNKKIKYFTSNKSVATVSKGGKITIKSDGTATISAISLEGNYLERILLNIIDGQIILKDSLGELDYNESNLVGNRYDDNSGQASVFTAVALGSLPNEFVAVGSSQYSDNQLIGLFSKYNFKSETPNAVLNIDENNQLYSEALEGLVYSENNQAYYAVGYYQKTSSSADSALITKVTEYISDGKVFLNQEALYLKSSNNYNEKKYFSVAELNGFVYAVGYEYDQVSNRIKGLIDVFNENLEYIDSIELTDATVITTVGVNPYSNTLFFAGEANSSAFIAEYNPLTQTIIYGYYSNIELAYFTDVTAISQTSYIGVGNGSINGKPVSFITRYNLIDDKLVLGNTVKNEMYEANYTSRVFYQNGMISVLGYAEETIAGFLNIKKTVYEYSTLTNFTIDLDLINNGVKYFNGNSNKETGTRQRFNDAILTEFNIVIGVGHSNYFNKDINNAYVQFEVKPL